MRRSALGRVPVVRGTKALTGAELKPIGAFTGGELYSIVLSGAATKSTVEVAMGRDVLLNPFTWLKSLKMLLKEIHYDYTYAQMDDMCADIDLFEFA